MATVTIKGIEELQKKLGKVATVKVLRPPMHASLLFAQKAAATYPPAIPGSKYIRGRGFEGGKATSEKLNQQWTAPRPKIVRKGTGLQGSISNKASYAPYVQDRSLQASVHRGRWQTIQDIVDGNLFQKRVTQFFQAAVNKALGR